MSPAIPARVARYDRVEHRNDPGRDLANLFVTDMGQVGWHGEVVYTHVGEVEAPDWAARVLGVEPGEPLWGRFRKLVATPVTDGRLNLNYSKVVGIYESLYVMRLVGLIPAIHESGPTGLGGFISRMADVFDLDDFVEEIGTRTPTPTDTATFNTDRDIPEMIRTISTNGGKAIVAVERESSLPGWLRRTYKVKV